MKDKIVSPICPSGGVVKLVEVRGASAISVALYWLRFVRSMRWMMPGSLSAVAVVLHDEPPPLPDELVAVGDGDGDALAPVRALPYGKQRLVEIAIALASEPTVLLLPTAPPGPLPPGPMPPGPLPFPFEAAAE